MISQNVPIMKPIYILKASNTAFVLLKGEEIVIIPDYTKATEYLSFGDAMRAAVSVNESLGTTTVRVSLFYK